VGKQKELLQRLQKEKEDLQKQMQANDQAMQNRIVKLHNERKQLEQRIIKASITIQRFARGFLARKLYK